MNIEEKIRNTDWHTFHKRHRSIFLQAILIGPGIQHRKVPFDHRVRYFGDFCDCIVIDKKEKEKLEKRTIVHLKKNPKFLLQLMWQAYKQHEGYTHTWGKLPRSYKGYSNKALANVLKIYSDQLMAWGVYVSLPLFVEDYLENTIRGSFKKLFGEKADEYFSLVADPIKEGSVLEEECDLLRVAKKNNVTHEDLEKHRNTYCWMANVGYMETYHPISYYKNRLQKYKKDSPAKREAEIISRIIRKLCGRTI